MTQDIPPWMKELVGAPVQVGGAASGGDVGDVKLPLSIQPIGGGVGILVDADGIPVVGDDGMPILRSMDAPGGAPAYSGTQAAQAAAFQHDQNMARLQAELQAAESARDFARSAQLQRDILTEQQRFADEQRAAGEKFQAEQNRLAEEAMLKRERLGVLQNLVEGFLQSQQRASEFVLQLQPDMFAFAAAAGGMPVLGTTPQQGYAQALTEFAGRPAPTMDPNAPLSAIEGGIESIMGQQMPLAPGMFSKGGTVPMGASGTFLVGEGGPEVMEVSPAGVTIKPLQGGFQYGGGVDFDTSTILQALAPLYSGLSSRLFTGVPRAKMTHRGIYSASYPGGPTGASEARPFGQFGFDILEALGIRPGLVQFGEDSPVFYRDPGTGALRGIPSGKMFNQSNFNWEDIVHYTPEMRERFDFGGRLTSPVTVPIPETTPLGSMPWMPLSRPLTEGGNIRAILPAPYKIAAQRRRLASVNPELYESTKYAYGDPRYGLPRGALGTAEDIFTPRGSYRAPLGLR